jgi:hypothetical protein
MIRRQTFDPRSQNRACWIQRQCIPPGRFVIIDFDSTPRTNQNHG